MDCAFALFHNAVQARNRDFFFTGSDGNFSVIVMALELLGLEKEILPVQHLNCRQFWENFPPTVFNGLLFTCTVSKGVMDFHTIYFSHSLGENGEKCVWWLWVQRREVQMRCVLHCEASRNVSCVCNCRNTWYLNQQSFCNVFMILQELLICDETVTTIADSSDEKSKHRKIHQILGLWRTMRYEEVMFVKLSTNVQCIYFKLHGYFLRST